MLLFAMLILPARSYETHILFNHNVIHATLSMGVSIFICIIIYVSRFITIFYFANITLKSCFSSILEKSYQHMGKTQCIHKYLVSKVAIKVLEDIVIKMPLTAGAIHTSHTSFHVFICCLVVIRFYVICLVSSCLTCMQLVSCC